MDLGFNSAIERRSQSGRRTNATDQGQGIGTMMKKTLTAAALLAFSPLGSAAPDYTDTAQVISATPILERITEQRQECTPVAAAPAPRDRSLVGPIVGGVAGGVLGSQVGRGSGRTAATAAGAIAGTVIGDRVGNAEADRQ